MQKTFKRVLATTLASVMALSAFSISASAYDATYQSETHTVFKHTEQTLAPGVEYYNNYAYANDGKQMVYYVTTADVNRDDVLVQVAYKDMQCDSYGMSKLSQQVAAANAKYSDPENESLTEYEKTAYANPNYAVVSATNGDGYNMTTGEPGGTLIMGGKIKKNWTKNASSSMFFAVLKDGRAVIGETKEEWEAYKADPGIAEAIDSFGSSAKLVWDGVDTTASASGSYNTDRHSRTMLGVTADGKVVSAVLDGRQEPFSCGGSMHELAQIMIEAGCVRAFNLDGGGSTTFMARMPGEDTPEIVNRPSDGSERSISNGIIIATTAKVKDEVNKVEYSPETEYTTPGSSVKIGYVAYDEDNSPITRPNGLTFEVSGGAYENGVFVAPDTAGDVTITAKFDGKNVGEQVIHVVVPDSISFTDTTTIYKELGTSTPISINAKYNGGDVSLKAEDFEFTVTNTTAGYEGEEVGSFDGYIFNAPAKTAENTERYKTATLTASVKGGSATASIPVSFEETKVIARDFEQTGKGSIAYPYASYKQHEQAVSYYATAETGKVKSGEYSMAIDLDFTQINEVGYLAINQGITSVTVADAKKVGIWIYIPENLPGLYIRFVGTNTVDLIPTGETYKAKYDSGAWHYFEGDVSGYNKFYVNTMQVYFCDRDGTDAGYYFKDATNVNNKCTLYFDDLTYDRTNGCFDFYEPAFGDITAYESSGTAGINLARGSAVDVNASNVSIVANVKDDTERNPYTVSGLDYSSAKAYIDGVAVSAKAAHNTITIEDIFLSAGVHTAKFVISDKNGNEAVIERQLNITTGSKSALKLVSRTPVDTKVLIGSVHWFDLVAEDISNINSAEITLDLDGFNNWQYKRIQCADGFDYTYTIDEKINTITLNFTRTEGTPADNTLASIPVKVWESTLTSFDGYETYTPANLFSRKIFWPIAIEVKPVMGSVTLADGSKDSFSFEKFLIDTEIDGAYAKLLEEGYFADGKKTWHLHTIEWLEEPHDATCTHYGTGGIGYCTVCEEIVFYDDEHVPGLHHYEWNIEQQKYICVDCGKETDEKPTIEAAAASVGVFSDGIVENGWVITDGEENNIFYLTDGNKVKGANKLSMYDGSGTYMLDFYASSPFYFKGLMTGAVNTANFKCAIYENGVLSIGDGDHMVSYDSRTWIANKDGYSAYTGTSSGFYVMNGITYTIFASKSTNIHGSLYGGLWTGPLNYSKNTSATENNYYIHGVKIEGWTCKSGAAYDADGNLVTGWRNSDGTAANVDPDDESTLIGKYYFGTDGKLVSANSVVYFDDERTFANARYLRFYTKSANNGNIGECYGFYDGPYVTTSGLFTDGMPQPGDYIGPLPSSTIYSVMLLDSVRQKSTANNVIVPVLYSDGYYYNIRGTSGYLVSQYRPTSNFFGTSANYNLGMEPMWVEARYTGVIDGKGYAIFGKLYEGYSLVDGKVLDADGNPLNASFVNGFGDNVFYKDGVQQLSGDFVVNGKAYTVVDQYGKAVPVSGIVDGKYYIDGIEADNAVYSGKYVIKDDKVCSVNEDGSIGEPVTGIIGETYFVDGVTNDYQIIDNKYIKDGDKLYTISDGVKGEPFSGIYNGVYYDNGSATEYQVFDGRLIKDGDKLYVVNNGVKGDPYTGIYNGTYYADGVATDCQIIDESYVFIDGVLYNVNDDYSIGSRVTGTVDGTKYTSGKPQNGWVADTYYCLDGKKVTGIVEIDKKAYKFNSDGELEGPYNGMLYDENADVYRMYDQGNRKNGSDEFGTCVDGVPADGWYASEYYFINGKYLTGIQQIDGFYYEFGEDGKGNSFNKFTGLFFDESDGVYRYSKVGELATGWIQIDNDWYYFDPVTKEALTGTSSRFFSGVEYTFDDNGKLTSGVWYNDGNGTRYYYGPGYPQSKWYDIDGETYYFDANGYRYEGVRYVLESNAKVPTWYNFGDNGASHGKYTAEGLFDYNGNTYYINADGTSAIGIVKVNEDYYYFKSSTFTAVKNQTYWASVTNDLLPAQYYDFDENGAIIFLEEPGLKNGIVDGYYYVDDVKTYGGLLLIDGKYYYARSSGEIVTNQTYWVSKNNDLLPQTFYDFGEDGAIIFPELEQKNGIVDGYYYVDDVKTYGGLLLIDGKYYYANSSGKIITDQTYWVSKNNDLLPQTFYNFGPDGVIIMPTESKNGIVDGYYYVGDVKTYGGLLFIEGKYYYANSSGKIITDQQYWVSKTNDLLPATFYNFGSDGAIVFDAPDETKNGIVDGYYYVDGVKTYGGLLLIEGKYYYANSSGKIITDQQYWVSKTNDLLPATFYNFGTDGAIVF